MQIEQDVTAVTGWLLAHRVPRDATGALDVGAARGASVLAVGEATHGSREFFEVRSEIVRLLVEQDGCRVIVLEASAAATVCLDRAVQAEAPAAALGEALEELGFWTWHVREMLAMLQWIRAWNDAAPDGDAVRLVGIDPQLPGSALRRLQHQAGDLPPELRRQVTVAVAGLAESRGRLKGSADALTRAASALDACLGALEPRSEPKSEPRSGPAERGRRADPTWEALRDATLVRIGIEYEVACSGTGMSRLLFGVRDAMMARLFLQHAAPAEGGPPVVLLAHNAHITFQPSSDGSMIPLGAHLRDELGDGYYALAQMFGRGEFLAKSVVFPRLQRRPRRWRVGLTESLPLLEHTLDRVGDDVFFLDFGAAVHDADEDEDEDEDEAASAWLSRDGLHRAIGGQVVPVHYKVMATEVNLRAAYSGCIYHRQVTASTFLPRAR